MISPVAGVEQFLALSPTLPPATRTNCFYIGDESQPKILIDPSPIDEAEYQRLINALGERRVDAILLTHHHPDHHHLSPQLAQHYKVPLLMSEKTHQLAKKKISPQYFGQNRIEFVSEVDLLTYSQDVPVKLMAVPGHDVGQLAPYRADGGWFIAGDLIQTVGTVVIGDEEGDMAAYFRSMQAVIDFNPRIVFPSHGIAMGGVHQLRATLEHRKLREGQILDLLKAGADEHKIFSVVYAGLPPQLERYARKTIQAHIKKIHDEKLL
jgi:glyoxylase-like metal-dependent hydrolase (beta-lactamase superfamily II)